MIVSEALEIDGDLLDLKWSPIDYSLGYRYINPNQNALRSSIPHLRDIFEQDAQKRMNLESDLIAQNLINKDNTCNKKVLENWVEEEKKDIRNQMGW
jgi:hypothetical protein